VRFEVFMHRRLEAVETVLIPCLYEVISIAIFLSERSGREQRGPLR
jgi:hypothetical protein